MFTTAGRVGSGVVRAHWRSLRHLRARGHSATIRFLTRLSLDNPALATKLSRLPEEQQRAVGLNAARTAVAATGLDDPRAEAALSCLEAGELDHNVEAAVAGLERELDERAWAFQDEDGGVIDGAWDEYLKWFRQARAAAALRFLFETDAVTAVGEAIYEAGAASDDYPVISDG